MTWRTSRGLVGGSQPTCLAGFPAQHPKNWQQPDGLSMAEPIQHPLHPILLIQYQHGWKAIQNPLTFGSSF